jgi:hypothetical protein
VDVDDVIESIPEIFQHRRGWDTREDIGPAQGLISRMLRYFGGNPLTDWNATSTGPTNISPLAMTTIARSAQFYVSGGDIYFSLGGAAPGTVALQVIQQGSLVTLTGIESIHGFQFCSVGAGGATLYGTYFD